MSGTIYMVHNGGEYSDYAVLGLFTDKTLAEKFAIAANGEVQEWEDNVPAERWCYGTARLHGHKKDGRWEISVNSYPHEASIGPVSFWANVGHWSGWDEPDPKTGEYTYGQAGATAATEDAAKKICLDAFWKKVAEAENL